MEEIKREREKALEEYKRKREEQLAVLPTQARKRMLQALKEWEAKINNTETNNPCHVLSPLF